MAGARIYELDGGNYAKKKDDKKFTWNIDF